MEIKRAGTQPSVKRPRRLVHRDRSHGPAVSSARPGARPGARTGIATRSVKPSIVTAECGWAQPEGGPAEEIHPADVVCFSPGQKHCHGATPAEAMTHIAIQEKLDAKVVDGMEHVSDRQYRKE